MPRRPLGTGETTPVTFLLRAAPDEQYLSADPSDPRLARSRKGRSWRAKTSIGTPRGSRRISASGDTPALARAALEELIESERTKLRAVQRGAAAVVPTLRDLLEWVRSQIDSRQDQSVRSERSRTHYLSVLTTWGGMDPLNGGRRGHAYVSSILDVRIDVLTPADFQDEVRRVAAWVPAKPPGKDTRPRHADGTLVHPGLSALRHLRALWRKATARAMALRVITSDPCAGLRLPDVKSQRGKRIYANGSPRLRDNALTAEQEVDLLSDLSAHARARRLGIADMALLLLTSGMRIGEASGLLWRHVDLREDRPSTVDIAGQVFRTPQGLRWLPQLKTRDSFRVLPLASSAEAMMRERHRVMLQRQVDGRLTGTGAGYVFPAFKGGIPDPDNVQSQFRSCLDACARDGRDWRWVTVHTFRRTVENRLIDRGVDPRVMRVIMAHTAEVSQSSYWNRSVDVTGFADQMGLQSEGR